MRATTVRDVDAWWAGVFGLDRAWQGTTVGPHTHLSDYAGWYVAWRGTGLHVSTPVSATPDDLPVLAEQPLPTLRSTAFWTAFAQQRGQLILGPSVHAYLDTDPGPGPVEGVVTLDRAEMASLQQVSDPVDWTESGSGDDDNEHWFGVREGGRVIAAATLVGWDGTPRDVGVLVAPAARGRGLGVAVGRAAASYAVREHGSARWRARTTNLASLRAAERIGFTPWATQLAVRPPLPVD